LTFLSSDNLRRVVEEDKIMNRAIDEYMNVAQELIDRMNKLK